MSKKRIVDVLLVLGIILVGGIILVKMVPGDIFVPESPFETKQEFFEAIEKGAVEKVEQALASGEFKPGIKNDTGITALMYAIDKNKPKIVEVLIENGAEPNEIRMYEVRMYDFFLKKRNEINIPIHPLTAAVRSGYVKVVKTLLKKGAKANVVLTLKDIQDINSEAYNLLKEDYSDSLLFSPLVFASSNGDDKIAKILLNAGADIGNEFLNYSPPLHVAASEGNIGVIKILLKHGALVDRYDYIGVTPLHSAIISNKLKTVEYLIEQGAGVNKPTKDGKDVALEFAAYNCNVKIVDYLLENGAKIEKAPDAILDSVDLASITERPKKREECMRVIKMLLEAGADPTLESDEGKTAFDYAKDEEIRQLLQKYADNREGTKN